MPIVAMLLDDVPEVRKYKVTANGVNGIWLLPQPNSKILLVCVKPIFYVLEWRWANPLYRWMIKRGLKKAGYIGFATNLSVPELLLNLLK